MIVFEGVSFPRGRRPRWQQPTRLGAMEHHLRDDIYFHALNVCEGSMPTRLGSLGRLQRRAFDCQIDRRIQLARCRPWTLSTLNVGTWTSGVYRQIHDWPRPNFIPSTTAGTLKHGCFTTFFLS